MPKEKKVSRREALQQLWDEFSDELAERSSMRHPHWHFDRAYTASRVRRAYQVCVSIKHGVPSTDFTQDAVDEVIETARHAAADANYCVRNTELAEHLDSPQGQQILRHISAKDLPREEAAILRAMGVDVDHEDLNRHFARIRARANNAHHQRHDVSARNVFHAAVQSLERELPDSRPSKKNNEDGVRQRPSRRFFKGVRKVILGSALVTGDLALAFGWPSPVFPVSDSGWGVMTSIIGGMDVGIDGVEDLWASRR